MAADVIAVLAEEIIHHRDTEKNKVKGKIECTEVAENTKG